MKGVREFVNFEDGILEIVSHDEERGITSDVVLGAMESYTLYSKMHEYYNKSIGKAF